MYAVSLSIDGPRDAHDRLRATPHRHERAITALGHPREAGIAVGCSTQLGAQDFRSLPALPALIAELGVYGGQVQLTAPMGRAADHEELWLQPFEMLELIPLVVDARRDRDRAGAPAGRGTAGAGSGPSSTSSAASARAPGTAVVAEVVGSRWVRRPTATSDPARR